ncbi:hypothetical protein NIES4071_75670 [Calothrix sp. NIES-4071]|nr:hypothetical protein NIES4071_75670 [Calothrix sp. NIES-4071]BAZ61842.1 hypothetical protein NIES4105_75620 [Calothrix sp. NIES-4105]
MPCIYEGEMLVFLIQLAHVSTAVIQDYINDLHHALTIALIHKIANAIKIAYGFHPRYK